MARRASPEPHALLGVRRGATRDEIMEVYQLTSSIGVHAGVHRSHWWLVARVV